MSMPRILLVDDDHAALAALGQGLKDSGYSVAAASSVVEALLYASREAFDLAVVDLRMPDASGRALAGRLQEEFGLRMVALSGCGKPESVRSAVKDGALGYLVKPVDIVQVTPSIEAALARAQELRALRDANAQLNVALAKGRETSIAIGVLMERMHMNRDAAFTLLRDAARSQRRKMDTVAEEILSASELLSTIRRQAG